MRYINGSVLLTVLLVVTGTAIAQQTDAGSEIESYMKQCRELQEEKRYDEALKLVDEGIEKYPDISIQSVNFKYNLLLEMKRYHDAIPVAIARDILYESTSTKKSLDVVDLYLLVGDLDNAVKWLEISEERGFQKISMLEDLDKFDPLRGDARFVDLMERIRSRIGIGKPVRPFERTTLSGSIVSPQHYKGKVLLIDFWATYCPPCIVEMPRLKRLYEELHGRGFEVISISVDSDRSKLDRFLAEKELPWPTVWGGAGWDDETRVQYELINIPSTWLVDPKGILRHVGIGGEELERAVRNLLNE